ncbi:MAG: 1-acyl-sn-glycerol-3-phosphate acyltransferase [Candidatus Marinimicrobia bacterium]|jgi:1-acyl-sn-glycerol-3-phosphate acyltransferase|nr:1-acyl-sn-glycerol-3-phosphate acyltransferase [Candidatus Neomarinimicrobiota bacterium]MBT3631465.1 1-acyl-sn-glycerol-3-phosphate acyltransferase [Candidatus Neomarinimicrobiota bacterium]MBT3825464.1 1-acyl-sn-glycerol-3-phosphate acyltransferase [Candidatus Neomarinimicrobiota bacterium]MBT4131565.1 1-acyl-sn-glycerol-3-phosphate acyltransferase [Candidatus Neomarinimicrobiota bacterium]MBT4294892.1 1-acyl-sn-glycerol-3-phosphate acyltransferase [Candidatus Neomarinimicrobiota bacterium
MLHYFLIIGTVSLWTAVWIPVTILGKLIDKTGRLSHKLGRRWAWGVLKISSVKVEIEGLEHIDEKSQYIFISNHTSAFDIPAIYWGIKNKNGMLAKKQLQYVPFFGWAMWAAGHFFVDRKDHRAALAVMEQVAVQMSANKGHSLVIFVEGTRSMDGQLQRFKKGAFVLSLDTGIPIVPIIINGARKAKSKKQRRISATTIKLTILPPMDPGAYNTETRQQYLDDARALFVKHYIPPQI